MSSEQFNLNWHTYDEHLKELMQGLLESSKSSDVTLVCEDKTKFKAHKFVLIACSPVFQSIIDDLPNKEDSVIYLRGVLSQEMKSILQFMYLGQATFYQDRVSEFLSVARSLEIKEISQDVDCDNESFNNQINEDLPLSKDENMYETETHEIPRNGVAKIRQAENKISTNKDKFGMYPCNKCEKQYTNSGSLFKHLKSVHEGMKYPCNQCQKVFLRKDHLLRHIKNAHEGNFTV